MRGTEDTLRMTLLFDFFGEILTGKQREYFDLYHNENLSLSEIAEQDGISRQGVDDIVSRAEAKLLSIESKTGIISKWLSMRATLSQAEDIARELLRLSGGDENLSAHMRTLMSVLDDLKGQV